jgi:hypothetical protein
MVWQGLGQSGETPFMCAPPSASRRANSIVKMESLAFINFGVFPFPAVVVVVVVVVVF